jgi:hypothetical protein
MRYEPGGIRFSPQIDARFCPKCLSITRGCEICGGNVIPVDDQSFFGYCDSCGIVYALKDRFQEQLSNRALRGVELGPGEEPRKAVWVSFHMAHFN